MVVYNRLRQLIADIFECEEDDITVDTDFIEDLYADSIDGMELAIMLEEEFDIPNLTKEDFSRFHTVGDVVKFVDKKLTR